MLDDRQHAAFEQPLARGAAERGDLGRLGAVGTVADHRVGARHRRQVQHRRGVDGDAEPGEIVGGEAHREAHGLLRPGQCGEPLGGWNAAPMRRGQPGDAAAFWSMRIGASSRPTLSRKAAIRSRSCAGSRQLRAKRQKPSGFAAVKKSRSAGLSDRPAQPKTIARGVDEFRARSSSNRAPQMPRLQIPAHMLGGGRLGEQSRLDAIPHPLFAEIARTASAVILPRMAGLFSAAIRRAPRPGCAQRGEHDADMPPLDGAERGRRWCGQSAPPICCGVKGLPAGAAGWRPPRSGKLRCREVAASRGAPRVARGAATVSRPAGRPPAVDRHACCVRARQAAGLVGLDLDRLRVGLGERDIVRAAAGSARRRPGSPPAAVRPRAGPSRPLAWPPAGRDRVVRSWT